MNYELLRRTFEKVDAICALEGRHVDRQRFAEVLELTFADEPFSKIAARARTLIPRAATEPPRRPLFYRHRPYLVPGTKSLLRNSLRIYDPHELMAFEDVLVACASTRLLADEPVQQLTVHDVHTRLFAEIYPWAGMSRIVEISKASSTFLPSARINVELGALGSAFDAVSAMKDAPSTACRLASWYAEFNRIHPFREGNGRTGALTVTLAARSVGMDLDFSAVDHAQWYDAAKRAMARGSGTRADPAPFADILSTIIRTGNVTHGDDAMRSN